MLQIQLRVEGRRCLVVGGGTVGTRRTRALLDAGADVTVVDPTPSATLEDLSANGSRLELLRRPFQSADVTDRPLALVVAATDDPGVNEAVGSAAQRSGVLVNRADDAASGDLAFPAVVRRGPVTIGVSSSLGAAAPVPALARWVARQIDAGADQLIGLDETALSNLAEILLDVREELHSPHQMGKTAQRQPGTPFDWHSVFDGSILELVQAGRLVEAKERIFACL